MANEDDMMEIVTLAALAAGIALVWTLGYLKGRWDAGKSIGRRYHITPR